MKKLFNLTAAILGVILMQSCGGNANEAKPAPGTAASNGAAVEQAVASTVELQQGENTVVGICGEGSTEEVVIITTNDGKILNIPIEASTSIDKSHLMIIPGNTLTATVNVDANGTHLTSLKNADDGYTMVYSFLLGKWATADNQKAIELDPAGKIATTGLTKTYANWGYFGDVKLTLIDDKNVTVKGDIDMEKKTITIDGLTFNKVQ